MEEAFGDETRQLSRQCVQHRWDRVAKGFVWSGPGPPASMKPTSLGRQIFDPSNNMERLSEVERPLASDFLFHAAAAMVMHLSYNTCAVTVHQRADTVHLCRKTMQAVQVCDLKFHQSAGTTMFPLSRCRWSHPRRMSAVMKERKYTHRRD